MMNGLLRRRRAGFGIVRAGAIETMDRKTLLAEAIRRCPDIEPNLATDRVADDETCRRAGWLLVEHTGMLFHLGRRLLELSAPGGALLPPLEFRLCRQTEPSAAELISAQLLEPWSLDLPQSGHRPACWKLGGIVHHPDHHQLWVKIRLFVPASGKTDGPHGGGVGAARTADAGMTAFFSRRQELPRRASVNDVARTAQHGLRGEMTKLWSQSDQHFEICGTPREFAVPQADIVANPQGHAGETPNFNPGLIIEL